MILKTLKVSLKGPLWRIHEFEIEGINVIERIEENGDEAIVTVKQLSVSSDQILDVFIHVGAPNGTQYEVKIIGQAGGNDDDLSFTETFEVKRMGQLRIIISKNL